MRTSWTLAVLAVVVILVLALPGATAHAVLASSTPPAGARLDEAPLYVSVILTEPTDEQGSSLTVLDANDVRVDQGDLDFTHGSQPMMRVSLPSDLPDGAYRIVWQALSETDGHTTKGQVGFAVGDFLPPGSQASDPQSIHTLGAVGRILAFTGLSLAFGAALFLAWVPGSVTVPRAPSLEALLAGAALHACGVALLVFATMRQTGIAYGDLAGSTVGATLLARLGLGLGALVFAFLALAKRAPKVGPPLAAVVLLVLAALGSARLGHASIAGLSGMAVDALHLLAATTWIGGLAVFVWLLSEARRRQWPADQVRVMGVRFGTAALVCVIALVGAGMAATLAIRGANWNDPLQVFAGAWGRFLAAKMALTLALVGIAAINRYGILEPPAAHGLSHRLQHWATRLRPDLRRLDDGAPGLRRLLQVEVALGVATLVLAALLTSISPPAQAQASTLEVPGSSAEFHGSLTLDPAPAVGTTSSLRVHVETHHGSPVATNTCGRTAPQSCVTAVIGQNGTGQSIALQPLGGGDWGADGLLWARGGTWDVHVRVQTDTVFEDTLVFTFMV